ncbi:MAG: TetR/AcrR family transcriptional regulator [Gammaproteobacteria bacterium]
MASPKDTRQASARRRLTPAARRRQLTDAALTVFARNGLARSVHADVAREAGVSVPTVFHYFPSRDALLTSVLQELDEHFMKLARRHHEDVDRPARQALADHALAFMNAVEAHPAHVRLWLEWSTSVREDTWPSYLAFQERLVGLIRGTIARGISRGEIATALSDDEAARLFVGCAHMAVMTRLAPPKDVDVETYVARVIDTVIPAP